MTKKREELARRIVAFFADKPVEITIMDEGSAAPSLTYPAIHLRGFVDVDEQVVLVSSTPPPVAPPGTNPFLRLIYLRSASFEKDDGGFRVFDPGGRRFDVLEAAVGMDPYMRVAEHYAKSRVKSASKAFVDKFASQFRRELKP